MKSRVKLGVTKKGLDFLKRYMRDILKEDFVNSYINDYKAFSTNNNSIFLISWDSNHEENNNILYEALSFLEKTETPYKIVKDYIDYGVTEVIDMDPFKVIPEEICA